MAEKESKGQSITFGGSCACGRISYTSTDMPKDSVYCHCVSCRKLSGAAFQCFPDVDSKKITFFDNKEQLRYEGLPKDNIGGIWFLRLSKIGERAQCASCHTPLAMRYGHQPETTGITLGTVDEETIRDDEVREGLRPAKAIFTSQSCWWYDPKRDGVPCRERFGGNFEEDMKAWEGRQG